MNHLILILICVLSIEIFLRFNLLSVLDSFLKLTRQVVHIIFENNISDHWKEKVIPTYALKIMIYSLKILLIFLGIISLFFATDFFLIGFFSFTFSFLGILESALFASGYFYLRKLVIK